MKQKVIAIFLISLLLPLACAAQVPEWNASVVLKVPYGDGEGELLRKGYRAGGEGEGGGIGGFYVWSEKIFIWDAIKDEIKIYNFEGKHVKSIRTEWYFPTPSDWHEHLGMDKLIATEGSINIWRRHLSIYDFVVSGGVIYILSELSGPDQFGITNSVYAYDVETGKQLQHITIYAPNIGIDREGRLVGARDRLIVEGNKSVSLYLSVWQLSYPIVRDGKPLSEEEQLASLPGIKFGDYRIRQNRELGGNEILDASGKSVLRYCKAGGTYWIDSCHGRYFLTSPPPEFLKIFKESGRHVLGVYDDHCNLVGCISRLPGTRGTCFIFGPNEIFRFASDGELYEIDDACDACYIYRWSK